MFRKEQQDHSEIHDEEESGFAIVLHGITKFILGTIRVE